MLTCNSKMPKIGISDLRFSDNKRIVSFCSLYIKASEFQCSSVYHWSSLVKDLCF